METRQKVGRSLGLLGATGIGVGAIVGGGILALAGVAFSTAGPAAIIAFALNGLIAVLTALSFAEMSTAFPESGGIYTFARKVLSVEAAFAFGWVVWFASIVASVLYALGFAVYALIAVEPVVRGITGASPAWLGDNRSEMTLAVAATVVYGAALARRTGGGGQWINAGKVIVFGVLIAGGLWRLTGQPLGGVAAHMRPFFPTGAMGVFRAMGYTFIALQGFDLISAVAGEVRDPGRNIPRAMLFSLGTALAIYLPFLFLIATVGMRPGESITAASAAQPEAVIPLAAQNYLGPAGYWLVTAAAVLSMLSALQANLLAASRVALAMARDRTLPRVLAVIHQRSGAPANAVMATSAVVIAILLVVPDLAAAGAAASLIFLVSFTLAHLIGILARQRGGTSAAPFHVPWFPWVPLAGAAACVALAVFQGIAVPAAGLIAAVWLGIGGTLFILLFARRARIVDASAEAVDPELVRLRGRSPLVLVPIANPGSAEAMVGVANALAPPEVGRVLLLSVIVPPDHWQPGESPAQLLDAQTVLREALTASFAAGHAPEALLTVAGRPWAEISRVARIHRCESLLLGLGNLTDDVMGTPVEKLMSSVDSDVVILRAQPGWRLPDVRRVLVAIGGRGDHDALRARLLGSLYRTGAREITFLRVMSESVPWNLRERAHRELSQLALDEMPWQAKAEVAVSDNVADEVTRYAAESDLVILGLQRVSRRRKMFGRVALQVARETSRAIIMISRRG